MDRDQKTLRTLVGRKDYIKDIWEWPEKWEEVEEHMWVLMQVEGLEVKQ